MIPVTSAWVTYLLVNMAARVGRICGAGLLKTGNAVNISQVSTRFIQLPLIKSVSISVSIFICIFMLKSKGQVYNVEICLVLRQFLCNRLEKCS